MFYALFKSENLIGIFDNKESVNNMVNGLEQNKLCNKLTIQKFIKNTICKVENNSIENNSIENNSIENNSKENNSKIIKLTPEEEEKRNKEKNEVEYELNKLKKEKEKIEESKKIFDVDLNLYKKFKKIKSDNTDFILPELFIEKYNVFEKLDNDNNLNWENFYVNYKQKNLQSSYDNIF